MDNSVKNMINYLDDKAGNFGFSQNFGMDTPITREQATRLLSIAAQNGGNIPNLSALSQGAATNYSVNPFIQAQTKGLSTLMVKIECNKVGDGSGNTFNPIWLFGVDAYSNTSRPYNSVLNAEPAQSFSLGYRQNKNVIIVTYTASVGNYSEYYITLGTKGEYPFVLNSNNGSETERWVRGVQIEISDAAQTDQLTSEINTFELDQFGKATTNDLTTPRDLYQMQSNGVYIPHVFPVNGRKGIQIYVKEVDALVVNYYFYMDPMAMPVRK